MVKPRYDTEQIFRSTRE
ncbi:MAG: hypothetical protein ACEY3D_08870 [Rickettsia sp.]